MAEEYLFESVGASCGNWMAILEETRKTKLGTLRSLVSIPKDKDEQILFLVDTIARLGIVTTELHERLDKLEQSLAR